MVFLINRFKAVREHARTVDSIGAYKLSASPYQFCVGTDFGSILEEAFSYDFEQKPNYVKLKHMMKMILIEKNIKPTKNFSWNVPSSKDDEDCDIPEESEPLSIHREQTLSVERKHLARRTY